MSKQSNPPEDFAAYIDSTAPNEVDNYGVPVGAFGRHAPPEFFEVLGRLLAVNGNIEYLKDRLDQHPASETDGVRKAEQFSKRYESGRLERNGVVHSRWIFGAHTLDSEVILGVRYKITKSNSGKIASVSIRDVPGSEKEQVVVEYKLDGLRKLLKRDITTMLIGERALTEVDMKWAANQLYP